MGFKTNHIQIDGSFNVDGSIYQWNNLFTGGGGGGTGDVAWASGSVGSANQLITANGDGSIIAESEITFTAGELIINGSTATLQRSEFNNISLGDTRRSDIQIKAGTEAIYFGVDPCITAFDTITSYIDNRTDGPFGILTDGVVQLVITPDGSIGINTTTPRAALDIAGNNMVLQMDAGGNLKGGVANPNTIELYAGADAKMNFNTTYATSTLGGFNFNRNGTSVLHIRGDGVIDASSSGPFWLGNHVIHDSTSIEINQNGTGNRHAFIDFHGDDTYTDYSFRIIRNNTGENATTGFIQNGTGEIYFSTPSGAIVQFNQDVSVNGKINSADGFQTVNYEIVHNSTSDTLDFNYIG